jgi:hypothetical protein
MPLASPMILSFISSCTALHYLSVSLSRASSAVHIANTIAIVAGKTSREAVRVGLSTVLYCIVFKRTGFCFHFQNIRLLLFLILGFWF